MSEHPYAITLDVGSSKANHTGSWRTERPVYVHRAAPCGGACPERRGGIIGDDPNKKPRFYVITGQEKDPASVDENAAWATVQTIYVF